MRKKTSSLALRSSREKAAPYTLRKTEPSDKNSSVAKNDKSDAKPEANREAKVKETKVEAKVDAKALAASDGKIDAKFDDVKSGAVPVSAAAGESISSLDAPIARVEPHDGAPKPGEGPKSATHNELPTEPARAEPPAVAPTAKGTVEDPTNMPAAKNIPAGSPTDPALPPGRVPPGDSRSLRRGNEFALVYRQGTFVISRFGTVGQRGQWRVVEYPTSASASHSYAKECSRFVADGFSDYRD